MSTKTPVGPAPRAVLYLRQSVAREESISLELQETAGRAYAAQHGYDVIAVEADPGISGRTWNRPAVQRVMAMIEEKRADIIILWKWSRLSRSRLDWAVAADKVETAGGRIESATEAVDVSTSTGRLARGMLTEFAAFESERIGDTWKEAHARRISQGLPANGRPRFGYNYTRGEGFTPDPTTGPILASLYRRFISGETLRGLAIWLNQEGIKGATGYSTKEGVWVSSSLAIVLDRGFGAGLIMSHGKALPGAHEPVITQAEWNEYQARREARRMTGKREATQYLLTGLVYCKECKGKMYGTQTKHRPNHRYRCSNASMKRAHKVTSILGSLVNDAVLDWLKPMAQEITEQADQQPEIATTQESPLPALRRHLLKNQARLDSLTEKYIDEIIPKDSYERTRDTLIDERKRLEARIRAAEVVVAKPVASFVPGLVEHWDVLPMHAKRDLISRVVGKIFVSHEPERNAVVVRGLWELDPGV